MNRRSLGAYATPADLIKAGTPTDEIRCVVCGSSWDGDVNAPDPIAHSAGDVPVGLNTLKRFGCAIGSGAGFP